MDPEGGAPRAVPSWIEGNVVRARFATERPGELDVQVVADVSGGPRPVLEATVFVDAEPSAAARDRPAPGEHEGAAASDDEQLARDRPWPAPPPACPPCAAIPASIAWPPSTPSVMAAARELAHDAGDGDPLDRMHAAGLDPHLAGENVAHAATLPLAHRAVWASPSHRLNLLGAATTAWAWASCATPGARSGSSRPSRPASEAARARPRMTFPRALLAPRARM